MEIVHDFPPMYGEIRRAFNLRPQGRVRLNGEPGGVLFCWGTTIYNPDGVTVPPEIVAHEAVHAGQQGDDPEVWWQRYIEDAAFRIAQEIPAHQAEYRWLVEHASRAERRRAFKQIAQRLSGPLYGRALTRRAAELALTDNAETV